MPTDAQLLELEKSGGLTPQQQEEINQRRDRASFPPPITIQAGTKQVEDSRKNLPGYAPSKPQQPAIDIASLAKDPTFLAASDEAKQKFLAKHDPVFASASAEAQQALIAKHFHSSKLRDMPAQDPLEQLKARLEREHPTAYALGDVVGALSKPALLTGAAILGGRYGRAGAAIATGLTSKALGDKPLESVVEAGSAGLFPGKGKTVIESILKSGAFGAVSSAAQSIAKGEWPKEGNVALNAIISGTLGYGFHKLEPYLAQLLPGNVAKGTAKAIEHGELPPGLDAEEATEIRKLRIQIRDKRGQFLPRKGADEAVGAYKGGTLVRKKVQIDGREVEQVRELENDDIFPPYKPTPNPAAPGKVDKWTFATKWINRPMWVAAHLEEQTNVPIYSDGYKRLRVAQYSGDEEQMKEAVEHVRKNYAGTEVNGRFIPKDNGVPEEVQVFAHALITAHGNRKYNTLLATMIQSFRKNLPFFGKEISDHDAQRIANSVMSLPSVELLAGRVGPAVRVFSHTAQTLYMKVGSRGLAVGLNRGLDKEGIRQAILAGAIGPEDVHMPEEILSDRKGWYDKVVHAGFTGFRKAQAWSRSVAFHSARYNGELAIKKVGWNNWAKFMDKAGLDVGIPSPEVGLAKYLYDMHHEKELLDHIGKIHAEAYIPGHSFLDQPLMRRQGDIAMAATQLSNWPTFYAATLKENFFGGTASVKKRVAMGARWALASTLMYQGYRNWTLATGGDEKDATRAAGQYTFFSPLFFTGGPILGEVAEMGRGAQQFGSGAEEALLVDAESGKKHMWQGAKRFIKATPIPFKRAGKDIYDLFGGKD